MALAVSVSDSDSSSPRTSGLSVRVEENLSIIRAFASASGKCSNRKHSHTFVIQGIKFGRGDNIIISVANLIWLSSLVDGVIYLPPWVWSSGIFRHLRLGFLREIFCFSTVGMHTPNVIKLTSANIYSIKRVYKHSELAHFLPPLTDAVIAEAARIHARVYSTIFSWPDENILDAAKDIVDFLGGEYNAVHIRSFEETCPCLYCRLTNVSHFSSREVPVDSPKWQMLKKYDVYPKNCTVPGESKCWSDLEYSHPLCNMTSASLAEIINLGNRTHYPLYIVADNLHSAHTKQLIHGLGAFSWHNKELEHIRRSHGITSEDAIAALDLVLLIHSGFFIQNTISTYSMIACILRQVLDLPTVPIPEDQPLEYQEEHGPGVWVSCGAVRDALW